MNVLDVLDQVVRNIRIPGTSSVGLSKAFSDLVDHAEFQRLRRIRQLGPTHLVYPGAIHTRFEHSLGVFAAANDYVSGLMRCPSFRDRLETNDVVCLLAAALLHDVGHYPYAHSLEALHSQAFHAPRHEDLAAKIIVGQLRTAPEGPSLASIIENQLGVDPQRIARIVQLGCSAQLPKLDQLLASIINSGIDADKLDYLQRDSIHLGVPYGRMPDRQRLISALTVNTTGDRIALTGKGRPSGEIFVFCRYLMFSEVYWHHTVRSASAMIEAAFADFFLQREPSTAELESLLLRRSDDEILEEIGKTDPNSPAGRLLEGLTDNKRGLYKRLLTLNRQRQHTVRKAAYDIIYNLTRSQCDELATRMRTEIGRLVGRPLEKWDLLIDAPPRDKDRLEPIEVVVPGLDGDEAFRLDEVSTVVRGVFSDFIKVVKKIRVFVNPNIRSALELRLTAVEDVLLSIILEFAE